MSSSTVTVKTSKPLGVLDTHINKAVANNQKFIVAKDKNTGDKVIKGYASYANCGDFLKLYNKLKPEDKTFYEVIPSDWERYEYFDLDCKVDLEEIRKLVTKFYKNDIDKVSETLFEVSKTLTDQTLFNRFKQLYALIFSEEELEEANFLIATSSSDTKISLHIINKSKRFECQNDLKERMKKFEVEFKTLIASNKLPAESLLYKPDYAPYNPNQLFRFVGSTKLGQHRFFEPVNWHNPSKNANWEDFLICIPPQGENSEVVGRNEMSKAKVQVQPIIRLVTSVNASDTQAQPEAQTRPSHLIKSSEAKFQFNPEYNQECMFEMFQKLSPNRFIERSTWLQTLWLFMKLSGIQKASDIDEHQRNQVHILSKLAGSAYCKDGTDKLISDYKIEKATFTVGSLMLWLKTDIGERVYSMLGKTDKAEKRIREEYNDLITSLRVDEDHKDLYASDIGIAKIYHRNYAKENLISIDEKEIYQFNSENCLWERVNEAQIFFKAADVLVPFLQKKKMNIITGLQLNDDKESAKELSKFFEQKKIYLESSKNASSVQKALFPLIFDKSGSFLRNKDAATHLLPLKENKVLNLKTLEVRERQKEDYFSKEIDVKYNQYIGDFSFAEKFFLDLANNDQELADYMKHFCGYCLTGETSHKVMFILSGGGNNGKSLLMNMLHRILGQFYMVSKGEAFLEGTNKDANKTNPELARMHLTKPRILCLPETNKDDKIESKMVKSLTGNDPITFRDLYQSGKTLCEFRPVCKPVVFTNYLPKINSDDQALINRIRLIPFNNVFKKSAEFEKLVLEEHIEELFAYICQGAKEVYDNPSLLDPIQAMRDACKDWVKSVNIVQQTIEDICITQSQYDAQVPAQPKRKLKIKTSDLFDAFVNETMRDNEKIKKQDFYKRVEALGYRKYKSGGDECFEGLDLKTNHSFLRSSENDCMDVDQPEKKRSIFFFQDSEEDITGPSSKRQHTE